GRYTRNGSTVQRYGFGLKAGTRPDEFGVADQWRVLDERKDGGFWVVWWCPFPDGQHSSTHVINVEKYHTYSDVLSLYDADQKGVVWVIDESVMITHQRMWQLAKDARDRDPARYAEME